MEKLLLPVEYFSLREVGRSFLAATPFSSYLSGWDLNGISCAVYLPARKLREIVVLNEVFPVGRIYSIFVMKVHVACNTQPST